MEVSTVAQYLGEVIPQGFADQVLLWTYEAASTAQPE